MTLTQLEYILAVAKFRHFGRAAQSCFVTQPTLSTQIQKLEEELEVSIFDRSQNPVEITTEGKIILDQAHIIIEEQKKLISLVKLERQEISGDLKIAVIPTLSPYVVPLFVYEIKKKFPQITLSISEHHTEDIIQMLKKGETDVAILVTPIDEPTLQETPLFNETFSVLVHPDHPLSDKKIIAQDDLHLEDIWLLGHGHCFRDQVLKICQQHEKMKQNKSTVKFNSGSFETLKNLVLTGPSYTILPQMCVDQLAPELKSLVRSFKAPQPVREVSLLHPKNSVKLKLISLIEEEILANLPDSIRDTSIEITKIPIK
jgi:LysR family hydrogen peroxide-inducible transcriptional activator